MAKAKAQGSRVNSTEGILTRLRSSSAGCDGHSQTPGLDQPQWVNRASSLPGQP